MDQSNSKKKKQISFLAPSKINFDELIAPFQIKNISGFKFYLTLIYNDLIYYSDNQEKGLNKLTFSKYYILPGIIYERLFQVFDSDNDNYINLSEFIQGMITLFTGNFETLVEFMFKFYDFDKNDLISIEDIRIVLSYIPLNEKRVQKMSMKIINNLNILLMFKNYYIIN